MVIFQSDEVKIIGTKKNWEKIFTMVSVKLFSLSEKTNEIYTFDNRRNQFFNF